MRQLLLRNAIRATTYLPSYDDSSLVCICLLSHVFKMQCIYLAHVSLSQVTCKTVNKILLGTVGVNRRRPVKLRYAVVINCTQVRIYALF